MTLRSYPLRSYARFITLEGGEGAGKSTVLAALRDVLAEDSRETVVTREPGGTPLAEQIRGLLLDVPVAIGLQRARGRGATDRIEAEREDFFERVREGYLARANADPTRFRVIDATQPAQVVAAQAMAHLREWIGAQA